MKCNICESESNFIFNEKVLRKYRVDYFQCGSCGFVQTESPYWLEEAYKTVIAATDTGILKRNKEFANATTLLLRTFFDRKARFLDYSGGFGIFCRMMRDNGYDFYWSDPYAQNLLVRGFEHRPGTTYQLITTFESFEHFADPLQEINKMFPFSENIFFSTRLLPDDKLPVKDWWYYAFPDGQHVSLYTRKALQELANRFGKRLYTNHRNLHLLTNLNLNKLLFTSLTYASYIIPTTLIKLGLKSKTHSDISLVYRDPL